MVTSDLTVGAVPTEFFSPFLTSFGGGLKLVYWLRIGRNHHQNRVSDPEIGGNVFSDFIFTIGNNPPPPIPVGFAHRLQGAILGTRGKIKVPIQI